MRRRIVWMLVVFAILPWIAVFVAELVAADTCLDAGGSMDYTQMVCDHHGNHPFVRFGARHALLTQATGIVLGLIGVLWVFLRRRFSGHVA